MLPGELDWKATIVIALILGLLIWLFYWLVSPIDKDGIGVKQ